MVWIGVITLVSGLALHCLAFARGEGIEDMKRRGKWSWGALGFFTTWLGIILLGFLLIDSCTHSWGLS